MMCFELYFAPWSRPQAWAEDPQGEILFEDALTVSLLLV